MSIAIPLRMRRVHWVVGVLLVAGTAAADELATPSVVGGGTVSTSNNALEFGLGHGDAVSAAWRHGLTERLEVGFGAAGMLGYRGLLFSGGGTLSGSSLGVKAQGRLKLSLLKTRVVSLGLSFLPGLSFATWSVPLPPAALEQRVYGLELPVDLRLGVALSERTTLGLKVEFPFFLEFWSTNGGAASLQQVSDWALVPRVALGAEHRISTNVLLFIQVGSRLSSVWTIDAQLGLLWSLPDGATPS